MRFLSAASVSRRWPVTATGARFGPTSEYSAVWKKYAANPHASTPPLITSSAAGCVLRVSITATVAAAIDSSTNTWPGLVEVSELIIHSRRHLGIHRRDAVGRRQIPAAAARPHHRKADDHEHAGGSGRVRPRPDN